MTKIQKGTGSLFKPVYGISELGFLWRKNVRMSEKGMHMIELDRILCGRIIKTVLEQT